MNTAELKTELFKTLDTLQGNRLEEAYGLLLNYINGKDNLDDWQSLTQAQQDAIKLGIEQLDDGEGREHKNLMSDIRKRYTNA